MKNRLETRRILIENTKQFLQQRCWKCLMHLYSYNKEFEMFKDMNKENKIKYATGVLGVLSPLCYTYPPKVAAFPNAVPQTWWSVNPTGMKQHKDNYIYIVWKQFHK